MQFATPLLILVSLLSMSHMDLVLTFDVGSHNARCAFISVNFSQFNYTEGLKNYEIPPEPLNITRQVFPVHDSLDDPIALSNVFNKAKETAEVVLNDTVCAMYFEVGSTLTEQQKDNVKKASELIKIKDTFVVDGPLLTSLFYGSEHRKDLPYEVKFIPVESVSDSFAGKAVKTFRKYFPNTSKVIKAAIDSIPLVELHTVAFVDAGETHTSFTTVVYSFACHRVPVYADESEKILGPFPDSEGVIPEEENTNTTDIVPSKTKIGDSIVRSGHGKVAAIVTTPLKFGGSTVDDAIFELLKNASCLKHTVPISTPLDISLFMQEDFDATQLCPDLLNDTDRMAALHKVAHWMRVELSEETKTKKKIFNTSLPQSPSFVMQKEKMEQVLHNVLSDFTEEVRMLRVMDPTFNPSNATIELYGGNIHTVGVQKALAEGLNVSVSSFSFTLDKAYRTPSYTDTFHRYLRRLSNTLSSFYSSCRRFYHYIHSLLLDYWLLPFISNAQVFLTSFSTLLVLVLLTPCAWYGIFHSFRSSLRSLRSSLSSFCSSVCTKCKCCCSSLCRRCKRTPPSSSTTPFASGERGTSTPRPNRSTQPSSRASTPFVTTQNQKH